MTKRRRIPENSDRFKEIEEMCENPHSVDFRNLSIEEMVRLHADFNQLIDSNRLLPHLTNNAKHIRCWLKERLSSVESVSL